MIQAVQNNERSNIVVTNTKNRLTWCFFLVLVFNLFLQLNAVEEFFDDQFNKSTEMVKNSSVCGAITFIVKDKSHQNDDLLQWQGFAGALPNTSVNQISCMSLKGSLNLIKTKLSYQDNAEFFFDDLMRGTSSGLSPPLV